MIKTLLSELREGLIIALEAIRANKVRTVLTTLGIVIGVTSVVTMSTAIRGIDASFQNGISALGADVIYLDKWAWFSNEPFWKQRNRREITMSEYEQFAAQVKLPVALAPSSDVNAAIKYKDLSVEGVFVMGSTAEYLKTTNFTFSEGRFFSETESRGGRFVVVLGFELSKNLFPTGSAVGKTVKIKGIEFRVVGVLSEQGSFVLGPFNPDKRAYIPLRAMASKMVNLAERGIVIQIRAQNTSMVEDTKEEAIGVMRKVRGLKYYEEDNFAVNQQDGLMSNINDTIGVIQIAGLFITSLSLFVGAIGIMNIMFVSVKERTREIGVRKAIGAKRRTILIQFLLESSVICLIGGFIGLLLSILLSMLIQQFIPTAIQPDMVFLAIFISLATGVIAGFAPAYSASKMDPVDALRYE